MFWNARNVYTYGLNFFEQAHVSIFSSVRKAAYQPLNRIKYLNTVFSLQTIDFSKTCIFICLTICPPFRILYFGFEPPSRASLLLGEAPSRGLLYMLLCSS